jgi:fermentation-respiration switch protein FrsA (DUF1100 family)
MTRRPSVRMLVLVAVLGVILFGGISAFFAWHFTGAIRRPLGARPGEYLTEWEEVHFRARDGIELAGWFVPCRGARQAVLLLHGHGSTRTQMLARAKFYHAHGYAAFLYDSRGHGESGGRLVTFGWRETGDLLGAFDWLRAKGFTEFGCAGVSLGGATVAQAAADLRDVRWVVLESVFPSLDNAVDRRCRRFVGLPGWLAGSLMIPLAEWRMGRRAGQISPRDSIANLSCPVLIMTGENDRHTLPIDARAVFDHAPEPKFFWLVPGAAHVDLYGFAPKRYEERLSQFLASLH